MPASADERDIRRLRFEAGMTISDLTARVHVTVTTLKRSESKLVRRLSNGAPIEALVEASGVTADVVPDALENVGCHRTSLIPHFRLTLAFLPIGDLPSFRSKMAIGSNPMAL